MKPPSQQRPLPNIFIVISLVLVIAAYPTTIAIMGALNKHNDLHYFSLLDGAYKHGDYVFELATISKEEYEKRGGIDAVFDGKRDKYQSLVWTVNVPLHVKGFYRLANQSEDKLNVFEGHLHHPDSGESGEAFTLTLINLSSFRISFATPNDADGVYLHKK